MLPCDQRINMPLEARELIRSSNQSSSRQWDMIPSRLSDKSMYLSNSVAKVGMGVVCISEM